MLTLRITYGPLMLWQPLVTRPIVTQTINFLVEYLCRDHKRTRQEVSAVFLYYLYKSLMVYTSNK